MRAATWTFMNSCSKNTDFMMVVTGVNRVGMSGYVANWTVFTQAGYQFPRFHLLWSLEGFHGTCKGNWDEVRGYQRAAITGSGEFECEIAKKSFYSKYQIKWYQLAIISILVIISMYLFMNSFIIIYLFGHTPPAVACSWRLVGPPQESVTDC